MEQAAQPVITREELDKHIEKEREKLCHMTRQYKKGYLTDGELIRFFENEIWEGFFQYLQSSGLVIFPHIKTNWHRFLEDHELYKKNMEPNSQLEDPWLRSCDENDHAKFYEAATADKVSFFTLMEAFRIPVECFNPYSEHCIVPDWRFSPSVRPTDKTEVKRIVPVEIDS